MDGVGVARIRPYSETRAKKVISPLREEKCPFRPDIYGIQRISCTSLELVAQYCFIFVAMLPRKRLICGCAPESDASAGCRRPAREGSAEGPLVGAGDACVEGPSGSKNRPLEKPPRKTTLERTAISALAAELRFAFFTGARNMRGFRRPTADGRPHPAAPAAHRFSSDPERWIISAFATPFADPSIMH